MKLMLKNSLAYSLALACLACTNAAFAFSAVVSPPRFELASKPGQTVRDVIEISHVGDAGGEYKIYTNDWKLRDDGSVEFEQPLAKDSCRPWVVIERPTIKLTSNRKMRYRFEVRIPPEATAQECRFAIMIEGAENTVARSSTGPAIPVSGRVGVIVYVSVGDAQPKLEWVAAPAMRVNGVDVPSLNVKNNGTAHARLSGFITARDARNQKIDLVPAEWPILPGRERRVPLVPAQQNEAIKPVFPITAEGHLEWGGKRIPFQQRFEQ